MNNTKLKKRKQNKKRQNEIEEGECVRKVTNQFPLQSLCISFGSVLLIIFITMFYVTAKLRKENIIDALRDDNM